MSLQAYITGLGNGVLLVSYVDDYSEDKFQAFYSEESVIDLAQTNKVEKILHVTSEGLVAELTIAFENGRLQLIRKPKTEENK